MKNVLDVLRRFLHPPQWVVFTLPPIAFAALTHVLLEGMDGVPAYIIYCMSAYCLVICILPLPRLLRKAKACVLRWLNGKALGRAYMGSLAFRGITSLYSGMAANFLLALFRMLVGLRCASIWFLSIAIYDLLLGVIRLSLILGYRNRTVQTELRCYRRTAWLLFF